jgi:hypothetical protein
VKPVEFCVPATKQNVQPPPPPSISRQLLRQDYVCYLAKCPKDPVLPPSQVIADQPAFVQAKFKAVKVCVPATKFPVQCGAVERRDAPVVVPAARPDA